jgi:hypothetical protein
MKLCVDNVDDASNYPVHVSSGSKGLHIYFRVDGDADISKVVPVPDVELRAGPHQTLAPGSVVNGNPYMMYSDPRAPYVAPEWMLKLCHRARHRPNCAHTISIAWDDGLTESSPENGRKIRPHLAILTGRCSASR